MDETLLGTLNDSIAVLKTSLLSQLNETILQAMPIVIGVVVISMGISWFFKFLRHS